MYGVVYLINPSHDLCRENTAPLISKKPNFMQRAGSCIRSIALRLKINWYLLISHILNTLHRYCFYTALFTIPVLLIYITNSWRIETSKSEWTKGNFVYGCYNGSSTLWKKYMSISIQKSLPQKKLVGFKSVSFPLRDEILCVVTIIVYVIVGFANLHLVGIISVISKHWLLTFVLSEMFVWWCL